MNRVKVIAVIGIVLFIIYVGLIVTNFIYDYLGDYELLVFSILLAFISINMIRKGLVLRSATTLWFALNMIIFAITIIVFELLGLQVSKIGYLWAIVPFIPSIINLVVFKNYIYIKLIIINIFVLLPLVINNYVEWNFWIEMLLILLGIIIGVVICRSINLDKENV